MIADSVDPQDTLKLALSLIRWLDKIERGELDHLEWTQILGDLIEGINPFAFKDFRAGITDVIEQRANMRDQE
jgi:hypothetical protein